MTTQIQIRGAANATQQARTLASRELDVDTTNNRLSIHNGSTAGGIEHATFVDVQNQAFVYGAGTGTNSITMSIAPAPSAYVAGMRVVVKAQNTNTGSTTINVNSLGAKTIKKATSGGIVALSGGELVQGGVYSLTYDGTDFLLEAGTSAGGSGFEVVTSLTASNSATLDFTNVFVDGYDYEIQFDMLVPATSGTNLYLSFSDDGNSTQLTSGYFIYRKYIDAFASETVTQEGTTVLDLMTAVLSSATVAAGANGKMTIRNPNKPSDHRANGEWVCSAQAAGTGGNGVVKRVEGNFQMGYSSFLTADSFRVRFSTGNITSGRVTVSRKPIQ